MIKEIYYDIIIFFALRSKNPKGYKQKLKTKSWNG